MKSVLWKKERKKETLIELNKKLINASSMISISLKITAGFSDY